MVQGVAIAGDGAEPPEQGLEDALGLAGPHYLRLGCSNCSRVELGTSCAELDDYHPCMCHELMGGGLLSARAMGWLRGPSRLWSFHAEVQNAAQCDLVPKSAVRPIQPGFCCRD